MSDPLVIVLGDWFVDENWLIARHHNYSSSNTGDIHYISQHKAIDKRMISLCGAAEIFEVLRWHFKKKESKLAYSFIGYGSWNEGDTDIIQCILCPNYQAEKHLTPYTIKNLKEPCVRDKVRKCPYKQCEEDCSFDARMKNLSAEENTSTNRIIRCYEGHGGAQPKLLYRFDWQLPNTILKYEDFQELNGKDILAIIIEDHGKGVVNCECIKKLIESIGQDEARKISWYIRTKVDKPSWIKTWDEYKITAKLVVSDIQLANYRKGIRRATYGKELGRFSLELLGEITDDILYEHSSAKKKTIFKSQKAAILLDNNTAIAKADNTCFNLFQPYGKKQLLNIGRTAMFFSALIAQDIKPVVGEDFGRQCDKALQCSYEWTKETTEAWNAEEPHFFGNYDKALRWLDRESRLYEYSEANYRELWNRWNASSTRYGIIHFADFSKNRIQDAR